MIRGSAIGISALLFAGACAVGWAQVEHRAEQCARRHFVNFALTGDIDPAHVAAAFNALVAECDPYDLFKDALVHGIDLGTAEAIDLVRDSSEKPMGKEL